MVEIKVAIIGGSGLDDLELIKNQKKVEITTPFGKPSDYFITCIINGIECVLMSRHGRKHQINPTNVNYRANIWALKDLGCTHVIGFSACGSLQKDITPGQFLIPDSFIDMTKRRDYTFYDGTYYKNKVMHIPVSPPFCNETRQTIIDVLTNLDYPHHSAGTAVVIEGPRYSSYAESILFRGWGAHVVNMTLVPEAVLAREVGLCYATIAIITDFDCWNELTDNVNVGRVLDVLSIVKDKVPVIVSALIDEIASKPWDDVITKLQEMVQGSFQQQE